ncbi:MAG: transglutaminase family protein [Candidatus Velthaea sp.]
MNEREHDGTIDHKSVEWNGVITARYRIEQTLRYEYDHPIRNLQHQLIIAPRARHLDQERVEHRIWSSTNVPLTLTIDYFGNDVVSLSIPHVEREIAFGLESTIVRSSRTGLKEDLADPTDSSWSDGGRLTRADEALLDAAADIRALHPNPRERAYAIMRFVHRHMTYTKNVTDVFTTASTAFYMKQGVCQDYSHIAIALARACGIGARYASGHLIGEGATHAWVEFLVPGPDGPVVLSLDPTYCSETDFRYVVVAIGRDYDDVPPTSGTFSGRSVGTLHGQQRVRLTDLTYAA